MTSIRFHGLAIEIVTPEVLSSERHTLAIDVPGVMTWKHGAQDAEGADICDAIVCGAKEKACETEDGGNQLTYGDRILMFEYRRAVPVGLMHQRLLGASPSNSLLLCSASTTVILASVLNLTVCAGKACEPRLLSSGGGGRLQ